MHATDKVGGVISCSYALPAVTSKIVVKPHGRLGPLRSEWITPCPRAAYRRDGLSRPFRRVKLPGVFILGRASHLDAFSGYPRLPSLPGVALAAQPGHERAVRPGPLVLGSAPLNTPTPTTDTDRTVSRRSEPSSCTTLTGEQPDPWDLLQPQDVISRHRGAKPRRRCELSGAISLLSPAYLLSVAR